VPDRQAPSLPAQKDSGCLSKARTAGHCWDTDQPQVYLPMAGTAGKFTWTYRINKKEKIRTYLCRPVSAHFVSLRLCGLCARKGFFWFVIHSRASEGGSRCGLVCLRQACPPLGSIGGNGVHGVVKQTCHSTLPFGPELTAQGLMALSEALSWIEGSKTEGLFEDLARPTTAF
jgi:hypothetical protein